MTVLGFDTSNYTTSVARFDGTDGENYARLLDVKPGELGLRQSDALFAHVVRLPELFRSLMATSPDRAFAAVGVSTRPRAVEGSYMPCFLAGRSMAETLGAALDVPVHFFSHQEGHIAAALWSAGRMDLMETPHLAWHLSGGTTELLLVEPEGRSVRATKLGGTTDISAGQVIDRTGKLLELAFPSGRALDALSQESGAQDSFRVKVQGLEFSLSGLENKVQQYQKTANPADTAAFVLRSVANVVLSTTQNAMAAYPDLPVVFSGGVASNAMLRRQLSHLAAIFAQPQYSTDNAMGIAVLAWRQENGHAAANI